MGFPAAYVTEAANAHVDINYYVVITGISTKFSKKTVSGLTTEKNLSKLIFNPSKIALDNVKTTVGSFSVRMIDPSDTFLTALQTAAVHQNVIDLYVGFTNLTYTTYHNLASYRVEGIQAIAGTKEYVITATDSLRELIKPILLNQSALSADIDDVTLTIPMLSTADFDSTGTLQLEDEQITWTSKTAAQLNASARGANGSTAADHKNGAKGRQVLTITANPITILLQLLISPGGGGSYDVLDFGMGIAQADVNVDSFETVRDDSNLADQSWTFNLTEDMDSFLAWAEKEILFFTNTRIYTDVDGTLALVLLEQVSIDSLEGVLPRASCLAPPDSTSDSKRIYNRVVVRYDWDQGTQKFKRETSYDEDTGDSQTRYGIILKPALESKGIRQSADGANIAADFAKRLLRRVGFPSHQFSTIKTLWEKQFFDLGQKVHFTHDQAINLARGELGVDQIVEILEKKQDFDAGTVQYTANASEWLSERWGFISPSSNIVSSTDQKNFTVAAGEGSKWEVGQVVSMWLRFGGTSPIGSGTITAIATDTITVDTNLGATPGITHQIKFADYDTADDDQLIYAYASNGSSAFSDGGDPYSVSD